MAEIIVVGSGVVGSIAGLLLTRDGHSVTMLDRDAGPLPIDVDDAWRSWSRRGVSQFRMPHILLPPGTSILLDELPAVADRLENVGGRYLNVVDVVMARGETAASPSTSASDRRFDMLIGRRTTLEWVLAASLEAEPLATVCRGVAVNGLVTGPAVLAGTPHVAGVQLDGGEQITADLVVDATGRNSPAPRWLAELQATPPVETCQDSGFAYYGRFYRSADGSLPKRRTPLLTPIGSISLLTIPSDNGTWSTMIYAASDDKPLRRLREPRVFDAIVRACPLHAHWIDGEPISDVDSMFGVTDRKRTFMVDGEPIVTGFASIGDAAACSNPSLGRGMSFGFMHARILRDLVRTHSHEPAKLARELGRRTEQELGPWYDETRQIDQGRITEMRTISRGGELPHDPQSQVVVALATAAGVDPTAARAWSEIIGCLTPAPAVLARNGLVDHVLGVAGTVPVPNLGPDRVQLVDLINGVAREPGPQRAA